MRTSWTARTLVLLGLASAPLSPHASAYAQAPDADAEARALVLFEAAEVRYQEGRYREAIDLLEDAWSIHPEPAMLYNMGRSHEELGEDDRALEVYRRYLGLDPESPVRASVEARIARLEARSGADSVDPDSGDTPPDEADPMADPASAAAPGDALDGPARGTPPAESALTTRPEPSAAPAGGVGPWPLILGGAGVAVLAGGIALGLGAQAALDDAETNEVHLDARRSFRRAETFSTLANLCFVAGGVLAGTGLLWLAVGSAGGPEEAPVSVGVGPGSLFLRGRL